MKVRMRIEMSGGRNGGRWPRPGEVLEVPDNEGAELCRSGIAVPVAEEPATEKAVAPQAEERAEQPKRGRPRKDA